MFNAQTLRMTTIASCAIVMSTPLAATMPVSLRIALVSPDRHDEALNRGFIAVLADYDAFLLAGHPAPFAGDALSHCAKLVEKSACARAAIVGRTIDRDRPPVVVFATGVGKHHYRWQCFGVGERRWSAGRQDVTLDLKRALLATPKERFEIRRQAIDCIMAAASEAKGRVRVAQD